MSRAHTSVQPGSSRAHEFKSIIVPSVNRNAWAAGRSRIAEHLRLADDVAPVIDAPGIAVRSAERTEIVGGRIDRPIGGHPERAIGACRSLAGRADGLAEIIDGPRATHPRIVGQNVRAGERAQIVGERVDGLVGRRSETAERTVCHDRIADHLAPRVDGSGDRGEESLPRTSPDVAKVVPARINLSLAWRAEGDPIGVAERGPNRSRSLVGCGAASVPGGPRVVPIAG